MTNRKEVAKKLRKAWDCNGGFGMTTDTAIYQLSKVFCAQGKTYEFFFNRLADLIDPTCRPVEADNNIVCSECGADLYDDDLYCSRCGSRVVREPEPQEQAALPADDYIDNQTLALAT